MRFRLRFDDASEVGGVLIRTYCGLLRLHSLPHLFPRFRLASSSGVRTSSPCGRSRGAGNARYPVAESAMVVSRSESGLSGCPANIILAEPGQHD